MTGSPLLHLLPLSTFHHDRDQPISAASLHSQGFVHCSPDVSTTLAVANNLYSHVEEPMVAVELDQAKLSAPVRWEAADPAPPPGVSGDVLFPHVYGPLDRDAVIGIRYARRDVKGNFLALESRSRTAEEFDLLPHPEGGWFRRTWASDVQVETANGTRPTATAIYFLLPPGQRSQWHLVASDEVWLWHRGGPLSLYLGGTGASPSEHPEQVVLGAGAGQQPQAVIPAGTWQCASAAATVESLVTCVVSPGFDFADFEVL
ncbi:cupin domain-containing protein [Saccharopolyspora mangrovi]|uniref:Cupin domain-containing protein n=1 Tax=Saccharopolyspora mangrovi TaxID=3082379 RepID=A0ABU6ALB6_9PSEU|nr:cupin domain-containing protein [Saccharopolyspora sp. S2-29]MEB3372327.1 cupin domain-containing protein [Saccharopolyspora sp. S2-29]